MIGRIFSHYRIVERLGAGGMGEVYKARDEHLGREVAVKVLPAGLLADESARRRFRREAETLSRLNHPHVAAVYDLHSGDGIDFLVMEYVPGSTLAECLAGGALPERDVASIGASLAAALAEAHDQGLIHCDLKPANVMLTPKRQVKVLDFGIARLASRAAGTAPTATAIELSEAGTLPYMAPEQVRGQPVDERTDIYAAGVVLYELATGRRPFTETHTGRLVEAILHDPVTRPSVLRPALSEELERIIVRCLERQPADRYQSAEELAGDLRSLAPATGTGRRPSAAGRRWPHPRRLTAALLVMLAAGAAAWAASNRWWPAGESAAGGVSSIVVLPSRVFGASADAFLTDAVPNTISAHLTQVPGLDTRVPPTSVEMQRVQGDLGRIGALYDVNGFVQSTITTDAERLLLNVQLVHARTRRLLWSREYEGTRERYLVLVREAAEGLRAELRPATAPLGLAGRAAGRSEAELAFQRGLHFSHRYNHQHRREDLQEARAAFDLALDLDPTMADAAAEIGWLHLFEIESGAAAGTLLPGVERWGRRAVQLDDRNSRGWSLLSAFQWHAGDARLGLVYGLRGAAHGARNAMAHNVLGGSLSTTSTALALEATRAASRLDPLYLYPQVNRSSALASMGQPADGLVEIEHVLRLEPEMPPALYVKGLVLAELRRSREALEVLPRLRQLGETGRVPLEFAQLVELGARLAGEAEEDRRAAAGRLLEKLRHPNPVLENPLFLVWLARHGSGDGTLELLEWRSEQGHTLQPYDFLRLSPAFATLQHDVRFERIVARARARFEEGLAVLQEADERGELPEYLRSARDALLGKLGPARGQAAGGATILTPSSSAEAMARARAIAKPSITFRSWRT